jgi:hypothetical protein
MELQVLHSLLLLLNNNNNNNNNNNTELLLINVEYVKHKDRFESKLSFERQAQPDKHVVRTAQ